jgi:aryl-alcohol dehydrogenase-like predicted oxidoreductase
MTTMMTLGRTGFEVSRLCLGTMMFGRWGDTSDHQCRHIVSRALDAGINFIDCADMYDYGRSEEILGRALRGRRDEVIVATKFGNPMSDDPLHRGASRRWITTAVENSLKRLNTDRIDLYQVHRPDPDTPIDETLETLDDLVRHGKVRAIGTSTFPAEQLVQAAWVAERRAVHQFATEQPPYSIFARGIEAAVLPTCEALGLGVLVWAPLNAGWLTGKYRPGSSVPDDSRALRQAAHFDLGTEAAAHKLQLVEQLLAIADDAGLSLTRLAIAFTLAHRAVTCAIVGPRSVEQLEGMLGAEDIELESDILDRIDALVAPGENVNGDNAGYVPPALTDPKLRRRTTRHSSDTASDVPPFPV